MTVTLDTSEAAARRIADDVVRTPTVPAPALSQLAGCDLRLKLENLQLTGFSRSAAHEIAWVNSTGRTQLAWSHARQEITHRGSPFSPSAWA